MQLSDHNVAVPCAENSVSLCSSPICKDLPTAQVQTTQSCFPAFMVLHKSQSLCRRLQATAVLCFRLLTWELAGPSESTVRGVIT